MPSVILTLIVKVKLITMPKSLSEVKELSYIEQFRLLPTAEKVTLREAMVADGCSKESFYRWLRENKMPLVWQKRFNEHYSSIINAVSA